METPSVTVQQLTIQSHSIYDAFYFHNNVDVISYYDRPFWAKNAMHLEKDIDNVTPAHYT